MSFINAKTARELVEEYNKNTFNRFLSQLNDRITDCAAKGFYDCCVELDVPEKERARVLNYLIGKGFQYERKNTPRSASYYKIFW